jgi:hypothetical protein
MRKLNPPASLKRGLPDTQPARRREYRRRYSAWWRKKSPGYFAAYFRRYRRAAAIRAERDHFRNLITFAQQIEADATYSDEDTVRSLRTRINNLSEYARAALAEAEGSE